jgi:hypothetical protein
MRTIVFSLVVLGLLGRPDNHPLTAAEPPKSPQKGKVLLLRNEHLMEGDIERVGDRYRVGRRVGETWVPADRVLWLAASMPDAYAFLRSRANLKDADERLRLANWCRLNGLREQAVSELEAAAQLRPDHAETQRLLQYLRRASRTPAEDKPAPLAAAKPTIEPVPTVELTTDSLGLFATRVQPILMNTCANCHATGRGGDFRLMEVFDDGLANRRALEQNLAAVLRQINLNQPESSRLLSKAVSDHAHTGQPPLRDRKDTPYRTLEKWVKLTVANNPHLRDTLPTSTPPSMPKAAEGRIDAAVTQTQWGADAPAKTISSPPAPSPAPIPVSRSAAAPTPPPAAGPADPYDPEPFNRQAHPETKKPGPGK